MAIEPICPTKADFTIFYVYQLLSLLRANALDVDVFVDCLTNKNSINRNGDIKKRAEPKRNKRKSRKRRRRAYNPNDLLNTSKAASVLGVSPGSLANQRYQGGGPTYSKLGTKTVRYRYEDLVSFIEQNKFQNTSQYETVNNVMKEAE